MAKYKVNLGSGLEVSFSKDKGGVVINGDSVARRSLARYLGTISTPKEFKEMLAKRNITCEEVFDNPPFREVPSASVKKRKAVLKEFSDKGHSKK